MALAGVVLRAVEVAADIDGIEIDAVGLLGEQGLVRAGAGRVCRGHEDRGRSGRYAASRRQDQGVVLWQALCVEAAGRGAVLPSIVAVARLQARDQVTEIAIVLAAAAATGRRAAGPRGRLDECLGKRRGVDGAVLLGQRPQDRILVFGVEHGGKEDHVVLGVPLGRGTCLAIAFGHRRSPKQAAPPRDCRDGAFQRCRSLSENL